MNIFAMLGFGGSSAQAQAPAPAKTRGIMITYYGFADYRRFEVGAIHARALVDALRPFISEPESIEPKLEPGMDLTKMVFEVKVMVRHGDGERADAAVLRALSKPGAPAEYLLTRGLETKTLKVIGLHTQVVKPGVYRLRLDSTGNPKTDAAIIQKIATDGWASIDDTTLSIQKAPYEFDLIVADATAAANMVDRITEIIGLITEGTITIGADVRRSR